MFFPAKTILVVCLQDDSLVLSEFDRSHGGPALVASSISALPKGVVGQGAIKDEKRFPELLKAALEGATPRKIRCRDVLFVLPESQSYLALLHFPSSKSPSEILQEAPKEALFLIPLDPHQVYCDFFAVPHRKENRHEVVYGACDKNTASVYLKVLLDAGLRPISFMVEPEAIFSSLGLPENELILSLALHFGRSYWILGEGKVIKKVMPSSVMLPDAIRSLDTVTDTLRFEADSILSAHRSSEDGTSEMPSRLGIWNFHHNAEEGFRLIQKLGEKLGSILSLKALSLEPKFPGKPKLLQVAYGAAHRFFGATNGEKWINLLPLRFREQAAMLTLNSFITSLSIMFIIAASAFMSVFSYAWSEMYFEKVRSEKELSSFSMNLQNERFHEVKKMTEDFNREVALLTDIQSKTVAYDKLWNSFQEFFRLPGMSVSSFVLRGESAEIDLAGTAADRSSLSQLTEALSKLPMVSEVISPLSNLDRTTNINYQLTLKLNRQNL